MNVNYYEDGRSKLIVKNSDMLSNEDINMQDMGKNIILPPGNYIQAVVSIEEGNRYPIIAQYNRTE